jgi:hypothetical protein
VNHTGGCIFRFGTEEGSEKQDDVSCHDIKVIVVDCDGEIISERPGEGGNGFDDIAKVSRC